MSEEMPKDQRGQVPEQAAASAPQISFAEIDAQIERQRKEAAEENRLRRAGLLAVLREAGALEVTAHYDGYGDSGNIEELVVLPHAAEEKLDEAVLTQLDDFIWSLAYGLHPGFENNEGGYGAFCWYIADDLIDLDHAGRYIETTHSWHGGI